MQAPADRPSMLAGTVTGRKGEILDAAVIVFADRGYEGGSMREIAERVGVTEPAIYRHFASKEDLFLALIEAVGTRIRADIEPLLVSTTPENITEGLTAVFLSRFEAAHTYLPVVQTLLLASTHNPALRAAYRAHVLEPLAVRLAALVPAVDAYYGVDTVEDEIAERVRILMSVFVGHFLMALVCDEKTSPPSDAIMRVMGWNGADSTQTG